MLKPQLFNLKFTKIASQTPLNVISSALDVFYRGEGFSSIYLSVKINVLSCANESESDGDGVEPGLYKRGRAFQLLGSC